MANNENLEKGKATQFRSGEEAARNQPLATGRTKSKPREKQVKAGADNLRKPKIERGQMLINAEAGTEPTEPQCGQLRTFLLTNVDV